MGKWEVGGHNRWTYHAGKLSILLGTLTGCDFWVQSPIWPNRQWLTSVDEKNAMQEAERMFNNELRVIIDDLLRKGWKRSDLLSIFGLHPFL